MAPSKSDEMPDTVTCPFTSEALTLVHSDTLRAWRAVGAFYFTRWFEDPFGKQELLHALLTRRGKPPKFPPRPRIEVCERERPVEDPMAAENQARADAARAYVEGEVR